jgi:hypothetical protein
MEANKADGNRGYTSFYRKLSKPEHISYPEES